MSLAKLTVGAFGSGVQTLHNQLRKHGLEVPSDEVKREFFGPKTRDAICEFQRIQSLKVSGYLDSATISLLMGAFTKKQNSPDASEVVESLNAVQTELIRLADWSGYTDYGGMGQVYAPKNEEEVISLVRYCHQNRLKLRVVGNQTSGNALWFCPDVIMTTKYLNRITEIDVEKKTITCDPGIFLDDIHKILWEKGLALSGSPGISWVTVGGAISTGSHGSGEASISASMIACRLVISDGSVLEIQEDDKCLDAVRISMGMLGILTSVTLKVVDAFYVHLKQMRVLTKDWSRFLTEGEMSYALWVPHTDWTVLMRVDIFRDRATIKPIETSLDHSFSNYLQKDEQITVDFLDSNEAVKRLANSMPSTFPARNQYLLDVFFKEMQEIGPAHEILMSFQTESIVGAEWSVPVSQFESVLNDMQSLIAKGDFYLPLVWLKKVLPETAWLSAADEECVQCGIYHSLPQKDSPMVKEMVMKIEQIMFKYGGRPHLGKLIYLKPDELKQLYPNWDKFNRLRQILDPYGMFWTELFSARFGNEQLFKGEL